MQHIFVNAGLRISRRQFWSGLIRLEGIIIGPTLGGDNLFDILKYIHDNIEKPLSAAEVAKQFGYSKWYFCKKFRDYTKRTFVEYVRHYRIQLASIDILQGKKITDVAMDYGYETVGGFNKAFLIEYGCLPKEYKKHASEKQLYYERRRLSMYSLTDRCSILRDEAVNQKHYMKNYCAQRGVYYTLGMENAKEKGLSNTEIIAAGIVNTLEKFTPFIAPGELVVGFNFGDAKWGDCYLPPDTKEGRMLVKESGVSDEDARRYFEVRRKEIGTWWATPQGKEFGDYNYVPEVLLTEEEKWTEDEWAGIGRCIDSNHSVIGYEKVLKLGFEGLLEKVECYEAKNGSNPLYRSMKSICRAACGMGEKYARAAEEKLGNGADYDDKDLKKIIETCSQVPGRPARNFHEAVQALEFAHIINTWEDGINANSVGRLDQILYPYYKADIEKGILTKEEAYEIICCLWIKLYRDYDVQQSCVGGTSSDGESMVNELSYMMLDAVEQLDFIRCLSVRFSHKTEKEFLKRALEVVGHVQKGVPFFFNDDVMIPALMASGISREDAYDYTQIGCVETVIPGKSNPHAVSGDTNLLKALEYVFCDGHSMMYPDMQPGEKTGALDNFGTYDSLYNAVLAQINRILDLTCSKIKKYRDASVYGAPRPYKSLLTEGCMETGKDFNDAGAIYDYYQVMLGGVPNLADSLMVIKKFVYEEQKYTLEELKEILLKDYPDESVRLEFINKASKFGNDIEEVDQIAVDIVDKSCDMLEALSQKYGISFHSQPFTYLWMVDHGKHSQASPDGRHKGEIIAYSVSPMQGRDFNGLTALLNSISKFPTKRTPGTTSAIVEVDPKLFTDSNIGILTDILIASGKKGLSNVQFNTIDADTLINAQKYPEKYNNLAVRVSGFSQKFNLLSPELQNHIIGRTKHACL